MKIALVMAGLPRFFDSHTYNTIKEHFLDKYDCDVYAHFWFNENEDDTYIVSHWIPKNVFPKDTLTKFRELYKPVRVEYENTMTKDESSTNEWYIMKSLYTSKQKAFNLISDVNQYDFIINMRSDSVFLRVPDLANFDKLKIHAVLQNEGKGVYKGVYNDLITIIPAPLASRFYNAVGSFESLFNKQSKIYGEEVYKTILTHTDLINNIINYNRSDFSMATQRLGGYLQICYDEPEWSRITDKLIK